MAYNHIMRTGFNIPVIRQGVQNQCPRLRFTLCIRRVQKVCTKNLNQVHINQDIH